MVAEADGLSWPSLEARQRRHAQTVRLCHSGLSQFMNIYTLLSIDFVSVSLITLFSRQFSEVCAAIHSK